MLLAENTVVAGRFRLSRLIGQGGMGSVWQATHLGLDIPCAVKFIEGEMAQHPEMQMRFEREAKAAAQLRSPHVVQILDHGVCEGTPYIAMELLDGEDLGHRFARVGKMPPAQLHQVIAQVCRALSKAHALGIVHRDLKPDNIFLVRDDDREIAKVLDFGIAKSKSNELAGSNTKTGAMLGTPYYMSPEQAQGTRALDYRSDLWSLGVITYQGLIGQLPFESEALGDLLMKIMVMELPMPSQRGCALPGIDQWWMKAAARDPAQRFQSAKEFSDSLALVCGVSQLSGVHDLPALAAAGAMPSPGGTMPLGIATAGAATPTPLSRTTDEDRAGAPRKSVAPFIAVGVFAALAIVGGLVFALRPKEAPPVSAAPAPTASAPAADDTPAAPPPTASAAAPTPTEPASAPSTAATAVATPQPTATARPEAHANTRPATGTTTPAKPASPGKPAAPAKAPADLGF